MENNSQVPGVSSVCAYGTSNNFGLTPRFFWCLAVTDFVGYLVDVALGAARRPWHPLHRRRLHPNDLAIVTWRTQTQKNSLRLTCRSNTGKQTRIQEPLWAQPHFKHDENIKHVEWKCFLHVGNNIKTQRSNVNRKTLYH